jgi:hypothetical protein
MRRRFTSARTHRARNRAWCGGGTVVLLLLAALFWGGAAPSCAQDLPIFDAHIHYSQPDWAVLTPDQVLAILDRAGVRHALVSSTPDDGTLQLYLTFRIEALMVVHMHREHQGDRCPRGWSRGWCAAVRVITSGQWCGRYHPGIPTTAWNTQRAVGFWRR